MKNKINQTEHTDLYYQILKECAFDRTVTVAEVSTILGINERHPAYSKLENLGFIKINRNGGNLIDLQPQGFSTYLQISSQKKSAEQAMKSTKIATIAIIISIASFIANIIFNLILYYK